MARWYRTLPARSPEPASLSRPRLFFEPSNPEPERCQDYVSRAVYSFLTPGFKPFVWLGVGQSVGRGVGLVGPASPRALAGPARARLAPSPTRAPRALRL